MNKLLNMKQLPINVIPTHHYNGYGCVASMLSLATRPEVKQFDEAVQLLAQRSFDVIFLDAANGIWITDSEAWEKKSMEIVDK